MHLKRSKITEFARIQYFIEEIIILHIFKNNHYYCYLSKYSNIDLLMIEHRMPLHNYYYNYTLEKHKFIFKIR